MYNAFYLYVFCCAFYIGCRVFLRQRYSFCERNQNADCEIGACFAANVLFTGNGASALCASVTPLEVGYPKSRTAAAYAAVRYSATKKPTD